MPFTLSICTVDYSRIFALVAGMFLFLAASAAGRNAAYWPAHDFQVPLSADGHTCFAETLFF